MTAPITPRATLFSYPTLNLDTIDTQLITARRTALLAATYFLATASTPMACALFVAAVAFDCALHVVTQSRQQVYDIEDDLKGAEAMNHYLNTEYQDTLQELNRYKYAEENERYSRYMADQAGNRNPVNLNGSLFGDIKQLVLGTPQR